MKLLTISGYKDIEDCVIGEQLIAYDVENGSIIYNELLKKEFHSPDRYEDLYSKEETIEENGIFIIKPSILLKTKEDCYNELFNNPFFYIINNKYILSSLQSIWANMMVVHCSYLKLGDIVYDDNNNDIVITSIETTMSNGWWRLSVSGDHSYISDGITLHNASRYWAGGGSSADWAATSKTNWGRTSGSQDGASVPASGDDVFFDGAGTLGNTSCSITSSQSCDSLIFSSGYTANLIMDGRISLTGASGSLTLHKSLNINFTDGLFRVSNSPFTITSAGIIIKFLETASSAVATINITLVGDLTVNKFHSSAIATADTAVNATTNESLIVLNEFYNAKNLSGTAKLILKGGYAYSGSNSLYNSLNTFLDGDIIMGQQPSGLSSRYSFGNNVGDCKLTYLSGNILVKNLRLINCTLIDCDNIIFKNIIVDSNSTITLNKALNGSPDSICSFNSSASSGYANIAFTDSFEKISSFIVYKNTKINNPGQLIVKTNSRFNIDKNTSLGIRYFNQSPNGFSKNKVSKKHDLLTGVTGSLVSDPNFQTQS